VIRFILRDVEIIVDCDVRKNRSTDVERSIKGSVGIDSGNNDDDRK